MTADHETELDERPPLCPDCGERHHPAVAVRAGSYVMVLPSWVAEMLGLEPEAQIEHPDLGHIEI